MLQEFSGASPTNTAADRLRPAAEGINSSDFARPKTDHHLVIVDYYPGTAAALASIFCRKRGYPFSRIPATF
jgi:hypothetical protein